MTKARIGRGAMFLSDSIRIHQIGTQLKIVCQTVSKDVHIIVPFDICYHRTANLNGLRTRQYRLAQES